MAISLDSSTTALRPRRRRLEAGIAAATVLPLVVEGNPRKGAAAAASAGGEARALAARRCMLKSFSFFDGNKKQRREGTSERERRGLATAKAASKIFARRRPLLSLLPSLSLTPPVSPSLSLLFSVAFASPDSTQDVRSQELRCQPRSGRGTAPPGEGGARGGRERASKGSICFFFQEQMHRVESRLVFATPSLSPGWRSVVLQRQSRRSVSASSCREKELRKLSRSFHCLDSIGRPDDWRRSAFLSRLSRSPKKKNSENKKNNSKASSRAVVAVRGVKVDAPINALDYDELTEVIR